MFTSVALYRTILKSRTITFEANIGMNAGIFLGVLCTDDKGRNLAHWLKDFWESILARSSYIDLASKNIAIIQNSLKNCIIVGLSCSQ